MDVCCHANIDTVAGRFFAWTRSRAAALRERAPVVCTQGQCTLGTKRKFVAVRCDHAADPVERGCPRGLTSSRCGGVSGHATARRPDNLLKQLLGGRRRWYRRARETPARSTVARRFRSCRRRSATDRVVFRDPVVSCRAFCRTAATAPKEVPVHREEIDTRIKRRRPPQS